MLTDQELREIRERVEKHNPPWLEDLYGVDVPRLLDEIERLREELSDTESRLLSAENEIQYPEG